MRRSTFVLFVLLASAPRAHAFCGFFVAGNDAKLYNNASKVVLLRKDNHTVMTLQNNYQGPPEDFALVVPVPVVLHKEDVKTLPHDVFDHIDSLSAPRLVEYWEQDPCSPRYKEYERLRRHAASAPMKKGGGGGDKDLGVKIEAQFVVGEYQIVILSAKDSGGLDQWLRINQYKIPEGAAEALAPYVREQSKFFVAKVDIKKVQRDAQGVMQLSPLRFGFDANELRLPVRLGLLNAKDKQDLIVYVLHPTSRFEVANYRNIFIPTNLEVADEIRNGFAPFYAQLFDATLAPYQGKAVVTEYAWQTSSCDPCPTPPLQPSDLATLGDDSAKQQPQDRYGFASWVLTRLHARYDKTTLSEDLIFKAARPVLGGRATWDGKSEGSTEPSFESGANNFQARYIIRHYWTGPVKCAKPEWGEWGGPPAGGDSAPRAAKGLATAARGAVQLDKVVRSPLPKLGIAGQKPPAHR
jgi:hypothetical protein